MQKLAHWHFSYPAPPFGSTKNWSSFIATISQSHIHKILAKISHISNDLYLSSSGRENRRCVKSQWSVARCRLVVVVAGATTNRLSVAPPNTQILLQRQSKIKLRRHLQRQITNGICQWQWQHGNIPPCCSSGASCHPLRGATILQLSNWIRQTTI